VVGLLPRQAAHAGSGRWARTPLLGRTRELATLQAMLAQVAGGRGQVVGVVGEPGMGKSRLLAEWRASLAAHEVIYLEGHCWSYGSAMPYLPLLDLVRAQCRITPADGAESIMAKVHNGLEAVDLKPAEWAPYLLHLLAVQVEAERLAGMSPEALKAKTFTALQQIITHSSRQRPLVIAVENLHWIDPTSEVFLARIVDSIVGVPILILATYRSGYRPPWMEKSYATQLALQPLSAQDSVEVMRAVLHTQTIPEALAQAVFTKAQGNPFFLEEIAQTFVEQSVKRGAGEMGLLPAIQLPETVQGVLAARIDRLPAEEKALLQTLAVIGHMCARRLLMQIVAQPEGGDRPDAPGDGCPAQDGGCGAASASSGLAGRGRGFNTPTWGGLLRGRGVSAHRRVTADGGRRQGRLGWPTSRPVDDGWTRGRGDRPIAPPN
jgi:predicted ATPase